MRLLKEREKQPKPPIGGDIFDSGLRESTESDKGITDPEIEHQTQVYPDNYRASRDGQGDWHWTNQNLPKGHPDRHEPPEDTKK